MTNDIAIITYIVTVFVLVGTILPFFNVMDGSLDYSTSNYENVTGEISESEISAVSGWQILGSVALMFFWTFGGLPWYIDILFGLMRIVLILTIARNIWIGGGG